MDKILITSMREFIEHPTKKISIEIPANNSLIIEIEQKDGIVTSNFFALLKWGGIAKEFSF